MKTMTNALWKTAGLAVAACLLAVPARSETTVSQEAEVGYQNRHQSGNEAKFEEYGEVPDGPVLKLYRMKLEKGGTEVEFKAKDVLQEQQSFKVLVNKDSKLKVKASWNQTPHLFSNDAHSPYVQSAPGVFVIPDTVKGTLGAANTTTFVNIVNTLDSGGMPLGFRRDEGSVSLSLAPSDSLKFSLSATEALKRGSKAKGASFGFSHVVELPEPIDYRIYSSNVGAEYNSKGVQLGFGYGFSSFKNDIEEMVWDNGKRSADRAASNAGYVAGDQSAKGRMHLAPDNVAHNVSLNAGANLPFGSRVTASLSYGVMSQNQDLQPYTINSAIVRGSTGTPSDAPFTASDPRNLPTNKANAKMINLVQNYGVTSNPWQSLTLGVKFRSQMMDNRTSEVIFPGQVRFDQVWEGGNIENHAFQYRKTLVEGSAGYQVIQPVSIGLSYGVEWTDRDHREVTEQKEKPLAATTDIRPAEGFLIRGKFVNSKRQVDHFDVEDLNAGNELPGLRRFDLSERVRNQGGLSVQMSKGPVNLALSGSLRHDDYRAGPGDLTDGVAGNQNQMYGLLEDRGKQAALDLGLDVNDRIGVSAFYDYEDARGLQRSNENAAVLNQDGATDWTTRTIDRYHTAGLGLDIKKVKDRADIHFGYDLSQSKGSTELVALGSGHSGKPSLPDTKITKQDVTVKTDIKITDNLSLGLGYLYEKYDVTDWATENVPIASGQFAGQVNIYLADASRDYNAHVGTVMAKYKW